MTRSYTLATLAAALARVGANLTLHAPGEASIAIGARPEATHLRFHSRDALARLLRGDVAAATEGYLAGSIDVDGELVEVMKATDLFDLGGGRMAQAIFTLALYLPMRRARLARTAAHYEQPVELFLPWFDRWRSYSHGIYLTTDDDRSAAQARKMQRAIDAALGLRYGVDVFDMGCGWGSFDRIRRPPGHPGAWHHDLGEPGCVRRRLDRRARLAVYRGARRFSRVSPDTPLRRCRLHGDARARAALPARHGVPRPPSDAGGSRLGGFPRARHSRTYGAFMRRHLWQGTSTYPNLQRLVSALVVAGFNVHELEDDTLSYACTVRDWARALEACRSELAARFGERTVRTFLLFLWGSHHFFTSNKTQAYHLVAGRMPRRASFELRRALLRAVCTGAVEPMQPAESCADRGTARIV